MNRKTIIRLRGVILCKQARGNQQLWFPRSFAVANRGGRDMGHPARLILWKILGVIFLHTRVDLFPQSGQIPDDLGEIAGRNAAGQIVACGIAFLRVGFDLANPSLPRLGILGRERVFQAFNHSLVMTLAKRDPKSTRAESNIGKGENPVVGCLESKVVRDTLRPQVRKRAGHDAIEPDNLVWAARLSPVPTELRQLL